jgi:hypothetical protein
MLMRDVSKALKILRMVIPVLWANSTFRLLRQHFSACRIARCPEAWMLVVVVVVERLRQVKQHLCLVGTVLQVKEHRSLWVSLAAWGR